MLRGPGRAGSDVWHQQVLPDLKDGDSVLQCYWWERMSGWEMDGKPLDAEL